VIFRDPKNPENRSQESGVGGQESDGVEKVEI